MNFGKRTLYKILNHLTLREGFTVKPNSLEPDGTALVTDSMGFIYEISVVPVGRIKTVPEDDAIWKSANERNLSTKE